MAAPSKLCKTKPTSVTAIRTRVRRQKRLWQRIPLLALMADGRPEHIEQYARAYRLGCWALPGRTRDGYFRVYVDLATGELVNPIEFHENGGQPRPVPNRVIRRLKAILAVLDAREIIRGLQRAARHEPLDPADRKRGERWRSRLRQRLKLQKMFTSYQRQPVPLPSQDD